MAVELKIPEAGESITEVQVGEWLKKVGDPVLMDEPIVMIETDKVTVEVLSPVDGVLSQVLITEGTAAAVGDVVGYVEAGAVASVARTGAVPEPASAATPTSVEPQPGGHVMPAAQRALAEAGLQRGEVKGSGPGGRVLKEDVLATQAKRAAGPPTATVAPAPTKPGGMAASGEGGYREEQVVKMTPLRKTIAARLLEAQQNAALLTTFNEIDMSAIKTLRSQYQPQFQERYGIKLGFMSFFIKAAVDALKMFPSVNSEIRDTSIVYKNYCDIGVAVGGGKGLVVPVIRDAERLSFAEVEKTIADFGKRAQSNAIRLDELVGGTFTISNGGVYGSLLSTPIVNPPQSGILGLHGIVDRPIAIDGQVVIRPMMYVALTYDHRVVDGREAVTFLKRIKDAIEDPTRLLIEV